MNARRTALRLASIALAAACLPAQAQVYRCEQDGKLAFSDQPCKAGAKATQKDYAPPPGATVTLDQHVAVVHYDVQGRDVNSLDQSLRANGPKGFHGLATWKIGFQFTTRKQGDGCRIDTVKVQVDGEIKMPRWSDEKAAPQELQQRWRNYYAALKRHEDGHIQNGRELALMTREKLLGMGVVPCEKAQALANAEFQRLLDNHKARDREYDERTQHGATQGVQL